MNPEDVRLLILDVDGVLTDGRLYLSENGLETRCFHAHDGQGLVSLLEAGVQVAVISGRADGAVARRLNELGIHEAVFDCADKYAEACSLLLRLGCSWHQTACMGDDIGDVPLLKAAGLGVAVANARIQARAVADWITPNPGGRGAVRDVCDWILQAR